MECPVDWVMANKSQSHAADMSGDLLKASASLRILN